MKVALVNPPLVAYRFDPFGSIPSFPTGIAYLAAYLRREGIPVQVVDAFGESPYRTREFLGEFFATGLTVEETVARIDPDAGLVGISVHSGASHTVTLMLIKRLQEERPGLPIVVGGNHASALPGKFIEGGADFVVLGEGELTLLELVRHLEGARPLEGIDGIVHAGGQVPKTRFVEDLDALPLPALDLLPLERYWELGYSHGPVSGRHLFLITSRGCPFNCNFCATPRIWQRRWRFRSAANVVDEIETLVARYGVTDFHIQDDNFTFNPERTREICREILRRGLAITWKLPSAVKAETIDPETLALMREAGLAYIAFSPESGSKRTLELMNKPVRLEHVRTLVGECARLGIVSQACFVLGYPGEEAADRAATRRYLLDLARRGVDEVSLFIMCPVPGAVAWDEYPWRIPFYEGLCWSPRWRPDYRRLNRLRLRWYALFFLTRMVYHPLRFLGHVPRILTRQHRTKGEMAASRMIDRLLRRQRT